MDFLEKHTLVTAIFLALFPRLTLLIASFTTGGALWWLGWVFCPHILVAVLAIPFFDRNPVLVILAWIVALAGTRTEASAASRMRK